MTIFFLNNKKQKKMKLKKDFLSECIFPELYRKMLNQGGVTWYDIRNYPDDYRDAGSGSVPGIIYYSDTAEFYRKNSALIHQYIDYLNAEGLEVVNPYNPVHDQISYENWSVWVVWESMMADIIIFLEN